MAWTSRTERKRSLFSPERTAQTSPCSSRDLNSRWGNWIWAPQRPLWPKIALLSSKTSLYRCWRTWRRLAGAPFMNRAVHGGAQIQNVAPYSRRFGLHVENLRCPISELLTFFLRILGFFYFSPPNHTHDDVRTVCPRSFRQIFPSWKLLKNSAFDLISHVRFLILKHFVSSFLKVQILRYSSLIEVRVFLQLTLRAHSHRHCLVRFQRTRVLLQILRFLWRAVNVPRTLVKKLTLVRFTCSANTEH